MAFINTEMLYAISLQSSSLVCETKFLLFMQSPNFALTDQETSTLNNEIRLLEAEEAKKKK